MKVLIVGSNAVWAIENHYVGHLRDLGVNVSIFNCGDYVNYGSLITRVLNRLSFRSIFRRVNRSLLHHYFTNRPDIVWVFKGVEIYPETLQVLKREGCILVNYNPDHPFIRTAVSHGGKAIQAAIPFYDAHFCYSLDLKHEIEMRFQLRCFLLPFGYEPSSIHQSSVKESLDIPRICMIGYADKKRAAYIKALTRHGLPVDVYGSRWNRYLIRHDNCRIYPAVYGENFWRTVLNYRVQLNIFRPHNEGSHNMRSFEIPSVGGIQLAPYSAEHENYFLPNQEIWLFRSTEEMVQTAKQLLDMPAEQICGYREAAKARCQREKYTYHHRAFQVKHAFDELLLAERTQVLSS